MKGRPEGRPYFFQPGKAVSRALMKKARDLLAAERRILISGEEAPPAVPRGELSVALAYPQRYYTAMSNLGFQTVYRLLNEQPETRCERVFLPDPEDLEEYRRTDTPLFSLESQTPVRNFDILAFSLSYENDYPHLLQILDLSRIPLRKEERGEAAPLVLAGGATVFMNPEPLADFVDLFVIGEAEAVLPRMAEILLRGKREKLRRKEALLELAALEGIYVPEFYDVQYDPDGRVKSFDALQNLPSRIRRVWVPDLSKFPTISSVVTANTELSGMLLVELSRGCRRRCRFCASCYTYFPYRAQDRAVLEKEAQTSSGGTGRIGLVGAAISDYPELAPLARRILQIPQSLSFSSLRVDALTPELADLVHISGQKTVTLAPEAGSERLREVVRKGFAEKDIIRAAEVLAEQGIRNFRLYFMVGLPTETMEDVNAIIELVKKIRHHLVKKRRRKTEGERITVSLNSFVPKPATPFQWHPFDEVAQLKDKIQAVRAGFRRERDVTVAADLPKWAYLQNLLSRGDRRLGRLLLAAHRLGGNWPQAYRSVDLNPDFYVYRQREFDEILPWDFIDHGIGKDLLWKEYQLALKEGGNGEKGKWGKGE